MRHWQSFLVWGLSALLWLGSAPARAQLELPTPLEHYETFDVEQAGRELVLQVMSELPEEERARVIGLFQAAQSTPDRRYTADEVRQILEMIEWKRWRPQVLMLFLHASRVLEVVPEDYQRFVPIVHDSFLVFLDRLSEERFVERLVEQINLPRDADRGERILAFIAKTPSLQKLAQIIARNDVFALDIRRAFQTLENSLATVNHQEILAQVESELGAETIDRYQLQFADEILAEASVGAILPATFVRPGGHEREDAACKVLKPYAISAMEEDLQIIDDVLAHLEEHADFYHIGETPLVDIFKEIREALSREVRVEDEQDNLREAGVYYQDDAKVVIPEVYPFSTANITCMEFIHGSKITDAYEGRPTERAELARRLSDALTFDVIFSKQDDALFHGDPHAGNVFHFASDTDPYRIALLDWGLSAQFSREDREKLIQLLLGVYLRHGKRLGNNVDVLLDWEPQSPEEHQAMREKVERIATEHQSANLFAVLNQVIARLAVEGYSIRYETAIFVKSQLTIAGILKELDPDFEQDKYLMSRMSGQVYKELHLRLLKTIYFPAWNSHNYRSMLSNEDVKDVQFKRCGAGFKKIGKGLWYCISFKWLRS
jgi:ubiquinone biosynthesis protein